MGSSFKVRLPLARAMSFPQKPSIAQSSFLPSLKGKRLLVVEDDSDTLEFLSRLLGGLGAELMTANSVDEALEKLRASPPDVLITDIGMPGKDGYELLHEMQKAGLNVPAIAVTAYARAEDKKRAESEGFKQHLGKPVQPDELFQALSDALKN
jgi:CheY-like chemotaxis protein